MVPGLRTGRAVVSTAGASAVLVLGGIRVAEREQTLDEISRLRDELYRARLASDRCRGSLQTSEASLLGLGITIDSLKNRVDSFESMDGRGVPAGRYQEYLEIFDSYNDSVDTWEGRERRLRAVETSCRTTIRRHNTLSDSLNAVLADAGIETG